jgi:DNA-binding protein HU-beta
VNKQQLIETIRTGGECGETKAAAERALNAVLGAVEKGLKKNGEVNLVGFGSFTVKTRKQRMGRNPRTGEPMKIKASKTVAFRCGKALKDRIK